jgi:hypothetical protein
VCEDDELAIHLLALVQPPVQGFGDTTDVATLTQELAACPGTYSGVVAALKQTIAASHDYHTGLLTGNTSVDGVGFAATVTSCDATGICDGVTGSKLFPLNGGDDQHLYAHAARSSGGDLLMEIDTLNGVDAGASIAAAKATEVLGLAALGGANGREMEVLGERRVFDGRDRAPLTAQARDLATDASFTLGADFVTEPTDELEHTDPRYLATAASYPARSYGCVDTASGSDARYGACLTDAGRVVVWVATFDPESGDPDIVQLADSYLAAHLDAASQPVFLDLRGNGGGSLVLSTRFLCTFGGDDILGALDSRQVVVSFYPSQFVLSTGRVVTFGPEIGLVAGGASGTGGDAVTQDDPTWVVSSLAPDATRRTFVTSWWGLVPDVGGESGCAAMRDARLQQVSWVVATMGPEFSACEDTLSFLATNAGRFRQIGSITRGGTGNPDTVTLPNTKLQLIVAKERQMDAQGNWLIEDVGVPPAVSSILDAPPDFVRRVLTNAQGQDVSGSAYSDVLFRTAEEQTFADAGGPD